MTATACPAPEQRTQSGVQAVPAFRSAGLFLWAATAAFGTYFCMYGVRMPFKVATYADIPPIAGIGFKTILLVSQLLGYTASKFIGISWIARVRPENRAGALIGLIVLAEAALVGFGLTPHRFGALMLFANGLPLGMVFGLVMLFLEGRRQSEAMIAGLCASFISADGVTKGLGAWVLGNGINPFWMPAVTGLIFIVPMLFFVWALTRIPRPDSHDVQARCRRSTMDRSDRWALFYKYSTGLTFIIAGYLLLTVLRSIRGDFAAEIWKALGVTAQPSTFAISENLVAICSLLLFSGVVFVRSNRFAFFASIAISVFGFALGILALLFFKAGLLNPFPFIVLMGVALYLPYMAVHTTLFERLLATTRDKGNISYLMYLVDSFGYLGYVAVVLGKGFIGQQTVLPLFTNTAWVTMIGGLLSFCGAGLYFGVRTRASVLRLETISGTS